VYEKDLVALPSMAAVLASPGFWMRERKELGIDVMKLVHGEQAVEIHAPLSPSGTVLGRGNMARIVDKGQGKGAIMHMRKQLCDGASDATVATVESVYFCRGKAAFPKRAARATNPRRLLPPRRRPIPSASSPFQPGRTRRCSTAYRATSIHCMPTRRRGQGRVPATDPSRSGDLGHGLPRHRGNLLRLRPHAPEEPARACRLPSSQGRRSAWSAGERVPKSCFGRVRSSAT
jgi:N-terminal half of MaoC dehydratase